MKYQLKLILTAILLIVFQSVLDNYLNITIYLSIALLPFIILILPYKMSTITTMITAFVIGILGDILGNGILGMTAAAMVGASAFRKILLNSLVNKEILTKKEYPDIHSLRLTDFTLYSSIFLAIYLLIFIAIDNAGLAPFGLFSLRFIISLLANILIYMALYIITSEREA